MTVFSINFGQPETTNQAAIMDRLRSEGYEVMQTSSGLLAKIDEGEKSVPEVIGNLADDVEINMLDISVAAMDARLSKDARQFVGL